MGYSPSLRDVLVFYNQRFYNNSNNQGYMLGRPWKAFVNGGVRSVRRDFWNCGWKTGYLKKLFIIPFPYGYIYSIARKNRESKKENQKTNE